jgi:uncharacterized protein YcfL
MKKLFIAMCAISALAGCSSNKDVPQYTYQNLIMDRNVQPLSRGEQIDAIKDCQEVGLRPRLVYAKRLVNGYTTETVIDIICSNKYAF